MTTYGTQTWRSGEIFSASMKNRSLNGLSTPLLSPLSRKLDASRTFQRPLEEQEEQQTTNKPEISENGFDFLLYLVMILSQCGSYMVGFASKGLVSCNELLKSTLEGQSSRRHQDEEVYEVSTMNLVAPGTFPVSERTPFDAEEERIKNIYAKLNVVQPSDNSVLNDDFLTTDGGLDSPLIKKQQRLHNVIEKTPISRLNKETTPAFMASPLKWENDSDELSDEDEEFSNSKLYEENQGDQYGTALLTKSIQRDSPDIEAEYLRKVFNNSYQPPALAPGEYQIARNEEHEYSVKGLLQMTDMLRSFFKTEDYERKQKLDDDYEQLTYGSPQPIARYAVPSMDTSLLAYQREFKTYQGILEEKRRRQQLIQLQKLKEISRVKPLATDELKMVYRYWNDENISRTVISKFNIDISVKDLKTLIDGRWLNDNIIDFYLSLVTERAKEEDDFKNVFSFSTHFFTRLKQAGHSGVARWTRRKKVNVCEQDLVLFPINIGNSHWALAVANNADKKFQYYDSLAGGENTILEKLRDYMVQEGKALGSSINFHEYTLHQQMKCPQQENGFDCGVFTCINAEILARGNHLLFSQADMKIYRRRMAYEIIGSKLLEV